MSGGGRDAYASEKQALQERGVHFERGHIAICGSVPIDMVPC